MSYNRVVTTGSKINNKYKAASKYIRKIAQKCFEDATNCEYFSENHITVAASILHDVMQITIPRQTDEIGYKKIYSGIIENMAKVKVAIEDSYTLPVNQTGQDIIMYIQSALDVDVNSFE